MASGLTFVQRWAQKVILTDDCWWWKGSTDKHGYGHVGVPGGKIKRAHRVAYEMFIGPIPAGLELDHLCQKPRCVNPSHLEPVTRRENLLRSTRGIGPVNRAKTHCPQGHAYAPENTIQDCNGRRCRECRRTYHRNLRRRKAAARRAAA